MTLMSYTNQLMDLQFKIHLVLFSRKKNIFFSIWPPGKPAEALRFQHGNLNYPSCQNPTASVFNQSVIKKKEIKKKTYPKH